MTLKDVTLVSRGVRWYHGKCEWRTNVRHVSRVGIAIIATTWYEAPHGTPLVVACRWSSGVIGTISLLSGVAKKTPKLFSEAANRRQATVPGRHYCDSWRLGGHLIPDQGYRRMKPQHHDHTMMHLELCPNRSTILNASWLYRQGLCY